MSPQNLVTPRAVVQIFNYARTAPWAPVWRVALATPNKPGTLNSRLESLEGRLSGKTGTLNSVNALSGYITTRDGRELIAIEHDPELARAATGIGTKRQERELELRKPNA